jgi:hypothetical protein
LQGSLPEKFKGFAPNVHNGKLGMRIVDRDRAWKTNDILEGGEVPQAIHNSAVKSGLDVYTKPHRVEFKFSGHNLEGEPKWQELP